MRTLKMNLSEKSIENLNRIHELLETSNITTSFASAMNIAKTILQEQADGKEIIIRGHDGDRKLNFI
jgi:hypothetical protein